jgi:endogenous inhibitor of DNA gyrase (YacG/DUF329 family)
MCRKTVERANAEFPFCSERCRTLDLGAWASEKYVISSPVWDEEELEEEGPGRSDVQ